MNEELKKLYKNSLALFETMKFAYSSDDNKIGQYASFEIYLRKYNQLVREISQHTDISLIDYYNEEKIPNAFSLTWPQQKQYFDSVLTNLSIMVSLLENNLDIKENKILDLKNFLETNLRKAVTEIPRNEKEIQDKIEILLIGKGYSKGIDYDRETGRVKISIKEVIPDFIFPKLGLALEIKFTKDKTKTKAIVDEINADIRSYGKQYLNILFLIYDFGTIRDESEFKNDIENKNNIHVIIIKH